MNIIFGNITDSFTEYFQADNSTGKGKFTREVNRQV